MIIFYTKTTNDIILASVVKHFNPNAILREYTDNQDILSIAKIHNETNFVRVKDFARAIEANYDIPNWLRNETIKNYIKRVLCHKNTSSIELISHLAEYLFKPEMALYSSIDRTVSFQQRIEEVNKEVSVLKRLAPREYRNDILFIKSNSEHNIIELLAEEFKENFAEPFVVLSNEDAILCNAESLGFEKDSVKLTRFDAFKLRKPLVVKITNPKTIASASVY